jgi:hypothetical protein
MPVVGVVGRFIASPLKPSLVCLAFPVKRESFAPLALRRSVHLPILCRTFRFRCQARRFAFIVRACLAFRLTVVARFRFPVKRRSLSRLPAFALRCNAERENGYRIGPKTMQQKRTLKAVHFIVDRPVHF